MKEINIKSAKLWMRSAVFLTLPFGLVLSSCDEDKLLNPIPNIQLQDAFLFDTPERVLGQVNGIYTSMKDGSLYGGRYLMLADIRGEDFINRTQNVFTGYDAWSHTVTSGSNDASSGWGSSYTAINAANLIIDGLAAHPTAVSETLAAQYLAEAKFVRAFCYFGLITRYGQPYTKDNGASPGVPLRLKGETTPANNDLARSSVAEVYAQILKDLDEAEAGLPLTYTTALLNTTRAHKNTAIAFKTRVYLTMGDYAKVMDEAKKIVSDAAPFSAPTGVKSQLQANVATPFMTDYTTTESIFSMPMTVLNIVAGQNSLAYTYNLNLEYNLNATGILGDPTWSATDARKTNFTRVAGGVTYLKKYNQTNPALDYVPLLRYAEVLLNYSEAAAKTGDLAKSVALLKAVRNRSDAAYVFPDASISTSDALVKTIWIERRIELLGEGLRSNDLLRNLLTIPAKGSGGLSSPAVAPTQPEYIFPIPNAELSTNKLI
ncbi:RagB/SusD family nutrient uptake outer membrane protein [Dyadobacter sp. CY345]|uniref:RagB/SusD family nutrient uptake outer membrane protein n=1 Tax=Dyadobacter sp. CY345 TaxID=2909335 RepID=UPI001F17E835|nr:RagB/SusD family nutrient uptake outer membrane protein [Dyadobacter sp. CY345]MCF2447210.1 RagB/SusD family nutrient uptake outer membrane protein [Dyadobacter sp. CY345]